MGAELLRTAHCPYISIQFGAISLTWRSDGTPDYFTSLTHKRIKDKASVVTINITYTPKVGEDPNQVEKAVLKSNGYGIIQYGDLSSGLVRAYRIFVNDYTVSVDGGTLLYSFTCTSAAVVYNFTDFSDYPEKLNSDPGTNFLDLMDICQKAADLTKEYYDYEDPTIGVPGVAYTSAFWDVADFEEMTLPKGPLSPIRFLAEVARSLKSKSKGVVYALEIDDKVKLGTKGKLRFVSISLNSFPVLTKVFNWGSKDSTVLDWSPAYEGSFGLAQIRGQTQDNKLSTCTIVDARTGKVVSALSPDKTVETSYNQLSTSYGTNSTLIITKKILNQNTFETYTRYAYKGTLKVLGEEDEIAIGQSVIQITPLIRGKAHHSAGKYVVMGVTDTVSGSEGFVTTYDVRRRMDDEKIGVYTEEDLKKDFIWVNGAFVSLEDYSESSLDSSDK